MNIPQCTVSGITDTELTALIECARRRLIVIAPGLSEDVARGLVAAWSRLGPSAVQVVLDPDPEVCRLGLGELEALTLLHEAARRLGATIHQQRGLRIGVVITDESTTIYSPIPLLVEAGGKASERTNAIRLEAPVLAPGEISGSLGDLHLSVGEMTQAEVRATESNLKSNPPVKFDLAQKVRVFNASFEFVEFELRGLSISRKTVRIPSDLVGLAKDAKAQKLLRSSFQLIEEDSEVSGERVNKLKQFIVKKFLISLPGYGTVILRSNKADFQTAVRALERYVTRFQRLMKKKLQNEIDRNRTTLAAALLPGVKASPPQRWTCFLGKSPSADAIVRLLENELKDTFGDASDVFREMKVVVLFKGVTYESLNDPVFIDAVRKAIPSLEFAHEEFDAARAAKRGG